MVEPEPLGSQTGGRVEGRLTCIVEYNEAFVWLLEGLRGGAVCAVTCWVELGAWLGHTDPDDRPGGPPSTCHMLGPPTGLMRGVIPPALLHVLVPLGIWLVVPQTC